MMETSAPNPEHTGIVLETAREIVDVTNTHREIIAHTPEDTPAEII